MLVGLEGDAHALSVVQVSVVTPDSFLPETRKHYEVFKALLFVESGPLYEVSSPGDDAW